MTGEQACDRVQQLVDSFRTLLDEALIVAIASDHDLNSKAGYDAASAILKDLAQDVPTEEATGFNPSGFMNTADDESNETKGTQTADSTTSASQQQSVAHHTDSSAPDEPSSANQASWSAPRVTLFNDDSEHGKLLQLRGMFPELKEYDVNYAFKKANGDFQTALDDLLNIQYLQATGQQVKGLDAFFNPETQPKSKSKSKRRKGKSAPATPSGSDTNNDILAEYMKEAKATTEQTEIGYIAERFNLTFDAVSETYYDNKGSQGATIVEILDQQISQRKETDDEPKGDTEALSRKYRHVPDSYLQCIVGSTNSIAQFQDDLAAIVNKHFAKKIKGQKVDLHYRLTPLPSEEIEGGNILGTNSSSRASTPISRSQSPAVGVTDFSQALKMSESAHQARREATASASQMLRKGASKGLYRQAAGFYAERAREHAQSAMHATSTAADLLVEQQSTSDTIDLHGVTVQDGTRIARQKAADWWDRLGEFRSQRARERPLVIITGIGRHSAGGVSNLRRSVAAALIQDGWKVEVGTGKFVLKGRR